MRVSYTWSSICQLHFFCFIGSIICTALSTSREGKLFDLGSSSCLHGWMRVDFTANLVPGPCVLEGQQD
jgi:hypothetical protein